MKDTTYFKQADLLLQILPFIRQEKELSLKGGTAINFFYRDLPRISVDIDLTYLPVEPRAESLRAIESSLDRIINHIKRLFPDARIAPKAGDESLTSFVVSRKGVTVKVEVNPVIRGTVFPAEERRLMPAVQKLFEKSVTLSCLSFADLFGGKICAALDRQHPRDWFDIKWLLDGEGLTDEVRQAFIVYLISHSRPMVDLLDPNWFMLEAAYHTQFNGMAREPATLEELIATRDILLDTLHKDLTENERRFLISVKEMTPQWDLFPVPDINKLPAVQWKLQNLSQMEKSKHKKAVERLRQVLKL